MTFTKYLKIGKNKKGQSALEYFILSAIVGGIVWVAFGKTLVVFEAGLQVKEGCFFQRAVGVDGLNLENQ